MDLSLSSNSNSDSRTYSYTSVRTLRTLRTPNMWSQSQCLVLLIIGLCLLLQRVYHIFSFWPSHGFPEVQTWSTSIWNKFNEPYLTDIDAHLYVKIKHVHRQPFGAFINVKTPTLFLTDLDLIQRILVKDGGEYFTNKPVPAHLHLTDPLLCETLIRANGEAWKSKRNRFARLFSTKSLRAMCGIFDQSCTRLTDYLNCGLDSQSSGQVNISDSMKRYTIDAIANTAFGHDSQAFSRKNSNFMKIAQGMVFEANFLGFRRQFINLIKPKLAKFFGWSLLRPSSVASFTELVRNEVEKRLATTGSKKVDFLQTLLDNTKSRDIQTVFETILTDSVPFVMSGWETTMLLLVFAMYELALNANMQDKLYAELGSALVEHGKLDYDVVQRLEYLDQVILETLRKYPPASRNDRQCTRDYKIPGTNLIIPTGVVVYYSIYSIHHDKEYYPKPYMFNPERFTAERKAKRHLATFQPFGLGRRNCTSFRFALLNAKMAIANTILKFQLEPCAETIIPMRFKRSTLTRADGDVFLRLTSR